MIVFSQKELAVLDLLISGKSLKESAGVLGVSVVTVNKRMEKLRERTGLHSTLQAAIEWDRQNR